MNNKLLLVKAVTLIYLQSKTDNHNIDVKEQVSTIINMTRPADRNLSSEYGNDSTQQLRDMVVWMNSNDQSYQYLNEDLRQRFKLVAGDDEGLYEGLCSMLLEDGFDVEAANKLLNHEYYQLRTESNKNKICAILKDYYVKTSFSPESIDWRNLSNELMGAMKPYEIKGDGKAVDHKALVSSIDFDSPDTVSDALSSAKKELSREGVVQTPFQGFNRMLGKHGGFRRGESVLVGALKYNYKTGFMYDIFVGAALFNFPYLKNPNKKPLNLRISFENKIEADIKGVYQRIYAFDTGKVADTQVLDIAEATKYVTERLSVNGWHNKIYHFLPSDYTYLDLFKLFDELESDGYEIIICTIDYLNMMSKKGCTHGANGDEIRDLYRRVKNECLARDITFITPHQLSPEAIRAMRDGKTNFVREVANKSYYDGCTKLGQEPDLEIVLNNEVVNGETYLTGHRGKHRDVYTPVEDHFVVYKFNDYGLPYDINGLDQSRKKVGGDMVGEGGSDPWFDVG